MLRLVKQDQILLPELSYEPMVLLVDFYDSRINVSETFKRENRKADGWNLNILCGDCELSLAFENKAETT